MPVEVTSSTLPSKTSSFSGLHAMASNWTLKMTSPEVSWMIPSPILVSRPSSFQLGWLAKKTKILHKQNDISVLRSAGPNECLFDPFSTVTIHRAYFYLILCLRLRPSSIGSSLMRVRIVTL
jgi:hypothetical protein